MSVGDCAQCLVLLQDVELASRRQMAAISRHNEAVQNDTDDEKVAVLKQKVNVWAAERQEAVDRYRIHLRSHEGKTMAAGNPPFKFSVQVTGDGTALSSNLKPDVLRGLHCARLET